MEVEAIYKYTADGVFSVGMTRKTFVGAAAALLGVTVIVFVSVWPRSGRQSTQPFEIQVSNNPQAFYLFAAGSTIYYEFTCDPRAADGWLFKSGGGTMFDMNPRRDSTPYRQRINIEAHAAPGWLIGLAVSRTLCVQGHRSVPDGDAIPCVSS